MSVSIHRTYHLFTSKRSLPKKYLLFCSQAAIVAGLLSGGLLTMPAAHAASCKLPKSYYKNVACTANRSYFLATKDFGAPVALIDKSGRPVADLSRYQSVAADKIAGGLMPVQRNSRVGYINLQGREVIPTMYDRISGGNGWARPVSEGRIVVKRGGDFGVIDTNNHTIFAFAGDVRNIEDYRGGTAQVKRSQGTTSIDKNGNLIQNPPAPKPESDKRPSSSSNVSASNEPNITPIRPRTPIAAPFTTLTPRQQDGRWGFVDDEGVIMITYSFDEVRPFSEQLAGVRIDDKWGFVNLGGELVIPFLFANDDVLNNEDATYNGVPAWVFKDGKAWVGTLKNGDKVCINTDGETVSCTGSAVQVKPLA